MRIVVWGVGAVESAMLWERAEGTEDAQRVAETLSMAWEDVAGPERWAVEIECNDDDVLRLVEETSGDDSVLGWSPAPRELPAAWFMADEPENLTANDW